jgi:hypothetical protein
MKEEEVEEVKAMKAVDAPKKNKMVRSPVKKK